MRYVVIAGGAAGLLGVVLALLGGPREAAWCALIALVALTCFAAVRRSRVTAVATALLALAAVAAALEWGDPRPRYPVDDFPPERPDPVYWADRLADARPVLLLPLVAVALYLVALRRLPVLRPRWPVVVSAVPVVAAVVLVSDQVEAAGQLAPLLWGTLPAWLTLAVATAVTWAAVRRAGWFAVAGALLVQVAAALTAADLASTWFQWWDTERQASGGAFVVSGVLLNTPAQVQVTEALIVAIVVAGPALLALGLPGPDPESGEV